MSDDFEMNSAFWRQVDEITDRALNSSKHTQISVTDDFDGFDSMVFDDAALAELNTLEALASQPIPAANKSINTSRYPQKSQSVPRQTTLFGGIVHSLPKPDSSGNFRRTFSQPKLQSGQSTAKTKSWPKDSFLKHGWKMMKKRGRLLDSDEEQDEGDEQIEFEQFPNPLVHSKTPNSIKLRVDRVAARNWVFPINREKREYQYNIIKSSLFTNCLATLPTGLGKTFIAAVVMYNYYRWFPDGKLIFVAPTKPLVNQQIRACHEVCGIPQEQCAVVTGEVKQQKRVQYWMNKRVFYMTPQTLQIELAKNAVDPTDIVLLVIDEAHRGTGNYAYAQVVRYLMHTNPFFRTLALSATPGSSMQKVQEIIDSLHISKVEMRDEESLDTRRYVHKKRIEKYIIKNSKEVEEVQNELLSLMKNAHESLKDLSPIRGNNYISLHEYRCNQLAQLQRKNQNWQAFWALKKMGTLSRAMAHLLEGSFAMCRRALLGSPQATVNATIRKNRSSKGGREDYKKALEILDPLCFSRQPHPKQEKVKSIALEHFTSSSEYSTRMIIFASYRNYVDEIVQYLNEEDPILRATPFIGQSVKEDGVKGMNQKEQKEILEKFKQGGFNILVATSVGEEGLDIGEVDSVICYDVSKDPIRTVQRAGRTGRKKSGSVHLLMAEDREENNWEKANDAYHNIQKMVQEGGALDLYTDVPRLIPDDIRPEPLEMTVTIEEFVHDEEKPVGRHESKPPAGEKRKRAAKRSYSIPSGASTGFVKAIDLRPKVRESRKVKPREIDFSKSLSDSEDDKLVMASLSFKRRKTSLKKEEKNLSLGDRGSPSASNNKNTPINITDVSDTPGPSQQDRGGVNRSKMLMSSPEAARESVSKPAATEKGKGQRPLWPLDANDIKLANRNLQRNTHPYLSHLVASPTDTRSVDSRSGTCLPRQLLLSQPVRTTRRRVLEIRSSSPPSSPVGFRRRLKKLRNSEQSSLRATGNQKALNADERATAWEALIDNEAEVSGEDDSEPEEEEEETEGDRIFLQPLPESQVPHDYMQTQVYRQSLFTQPSIMSGPIQFEERPVRQRRLARQESSKRRPGVSSSPPQVASPDFYEYDSFIVPDEDD